MQPLLPSTLSSRITCPDLLVQILRHTPKKTLVHCMRVSRSFYSAAAPMIYKEINLRPPSSVDDLVRGAEIDAGYRSSQGEPPMANLKADLLSLIKIVDIFPHYAMCEEYCDEIDGPNDIAILLKHLGKVDTVRYTFPLRSDYDPSPEVYCICLLEDDNPLDDDMVDEADTDDDALPPVPDCSLLKKIRATKVVLTSLLTTGCLWNLREVLQNAEVLTIILSPDTETIRPQNAKAIRWHMHMMSKRCPGAKLRLIVAPRSLKVSTSGQCFDCYIENTSMRSEHAVESSKLLDFVGKTISSRFETTVYLIEGVNGCPRYRRPDRDRHTSEIIKPPEYHQLPSREALEYGLRARFSGYDGRLSQGRIQDPSRLSPRRSYRRDRCRRAGQMEKRGVHGTAAARR